MQPSQLWAPNPGPQTELLSSPAFEVFYGGARGGGKTEGLLVDACRQAEPANIAAKIFRAHSDWPMQQIEQAARQASRQYKAIFFRRTLPELDELMDRAEFKIKTWFPSTKIRRQDKIILFPSGASMRFRYLKHPTDWMQYQGHEYAWVGFEELVNFPDDLLYMTLFACCRTSNPWLDCYVRSSGNPWGPGINWVRARFVDIGPWKQIQYFRYENPFTKETATLTRQFIPAGVQDNPVLLKSDPMYVARLQSLPERQRRAMLLGDWDAAQGLVFTEFDRRVHVLSKQEAVAMGMKSDLTPPAEWPVYMSFDWGWGRPFSIGWWTVDPWDRIIRFAEWYGCAKDDEGRPRPNEGVRLRDDEIARGIAEREVRMGLSEVDAEGMIVNSRVEARIADPSPTVFGQRKAAGSDYVGPSCEDTFADWGIYLIPADNARIAGKSQLHQRLASVAIDGDRLSPRLFVVDECADWIRTVPSLPPDPRNPEDIDTDAEDHAYDETRYFLMSRPLSGHEPAAKEDRWRKEWLAGSGGGRDWRVN